MRSVEDVEQILAGAFVVAPPVLGPLDLFIDLVGQQEHSVEMLGAEGEGMEIVQGVEQASPPQQIQRGQAVHAPRRPEGQPGVGCEGNEPDAAFRRRLRAEECGAAGGVGHPDHSVAAGREHTRRVDPRALRPRRQC